MLPVRLAVLNCETTKLPVFVAKQGPITTLYIKVFVPIAANDGVIKPVTGLIAAGDMPVEKVPPAGETVIVAGNPVEHISIMGEITTVGAGTTVKDVDNET